MNDPTPARREEEGRALRPYRRFVRILFALAIVGFCAIILRGIIRTLDRLPSVERLDRPERVDERALRACAEDLERLEARVRRSGGEALARADSKVGAEQWKVTADAIEVDRLRIVARCHLEEASADTAASELANAARSMESLIRSYHFLHARHVAEGLPESEAARASIRRALETLDERK